MAERVQVELVDDLDGSPAQHTVTFGLDGTSYEIDLSEQNNRALRSLLARYIDQARGAENAPAATQATTKRQERRDRQARQANRQLTEQIRGAAQRTRDRLKQPEEGESDSAADAASGDEVTDDSTLATGATELTEQRFEEFSAHTATDGMAGNGEPQSESGEKGSVPAVVLPQFSAARD